MKADYLTYRKATSVSVLGLVIQTAQALILLIYGVLHRDTVTLSGALIVGFGVPVWLGLSIVFDQHRRERIEALEAEALAQTSGASGSVFDSSGDEFRVASRRLASLYRYFIPAVSLLVGGGLLLAGILRIRVIGSQIKAQEGQIPASLSDPDGWAIAVGLGMAVTGFIFARFVSGMAKHPAWANLRGGAAYAVASSLIGLAITVGHFVDYAGTDAVRRHLPIALALLMVLLGAEVFLNFVLDLYRPRKAGENPRPAFDSRVLSFVAAPDRIAKSVSEAINYQLGFDVSSSWFYQLISRRIGALAAVAVLVVWGLSSFTVIQPHQQGMVLRWGSFSRVIEPGLNVKLPWPMERVEIPDYSRKLPDRPREVLGYTTTGVRVLDLGSPPPANTMTAILWTNDHVGEEVYQVVQPSRLESLRMVEPATRRGESGVALVSVEIPMYYAVRDVRQFDSFAPPEMRDGLLEAVARREIMRFLSHRTVDEVVGGDRASLNEELARSLRSAFERLNPGPDGVGRGAGIEVLFVGITNAHPNKAVSQSFEKVVQADRKMEAKIESARKEEVEILTKVVGSTDLARRLSEEIVTLERMQLEKAAAGAITEQELKIQSLLERAGGSASELVARAKAERWTRHMGERGRASRYLGQIVAFEASPAVFRAGEYFDALRAAMAGSRVFIVSDAVSDLRLQAELQDVDTGVSTFMPRGDSPRDY
ncbi:MAG: hypothetical protein KF787_02650 [Phycisphaeraceae bacterium]|nr:hypothetical protein [Phycisphaeraceae bacterium]